MKFILEVWPEEADTPEDALEFALAAIDNNPDLVWDIVDEDGDRRAVNVTRRGAWKGDGAERWQDGAHD